VRRLCQSVDEGADRIVAVDGPDVAPEGEEVAPPPVGVKEVGDPLFVERRECRLELSQPGSDLGFYF
jgi:hypothetical protein